MKSVESWRIEEVRNIDLVKKVRPPWYMEAPAIKRNGGIDMLRKKAMVSVITLGLVSSHLTGCALLQPREMVEAINGGESIVIEVAEPSTYTISPIKGEQQSEVTWVQLDQLKTHTNGFRQGFDKQFNITVVTENNIGGKSGCLYINPQGERDGNTTIKDAIRNKPFNTKYWVDPMLRLELVKLANTVYVDISDQDEATSLLAALNAYYNLLNDSQNPDAFNATQSLSREEFYTLLFKAENGVHPLDEAKLAEYEAKAGQTPYSRYASQIADKGWLQIANSSLDGTNASGSITRLEAVYMVVNTLFPDELAKVTDSDKAYTDIKNAGDLALKAGFKEQIKVEGQKEKQTIAKDRWQAYALSYSLQNPQKGVQRELYRAAVVAHNLGLLPGDEMRWDESISKAEALQLLMDGYQAQNQLYGYLTEVENGRIVNNFSVQEESVAPAGADADGGEARPAQFELVYNEKTGIYEEVYVGDAIDGQPATPGTNPLDGKTPEEIDAWMRDTSDAPTAEDLKKAEEEAKKKEQENKGNGNGQQGGGQTGGGQGQSGLTPEQQAELQKILEETGAGSKQDGAGTGTGRPADQQSDVHINWN